MAGELVLDASVAAKCFITEEGSEAARARVLSGQRFVAPELLLVEMASIAAKRVRRGDIDTMLGGLIVKDAKNLIDEIVPALDLIGPAFDFALQGFSAYDGVYLALAAQRGSAVLTADAKMVSRAVDRGFGNLVITL